MDHSAQRQEQMHWLQVDLMVHVNRAAQAMGYDSILAAISYAEDDTAPSWQAEGQALRAWRTSCWARFFRLTSGTELPTWDRLRAQLPPAPTKETA